MLPSIATALLTFFATCSAQGSDSQVIADLFLSPSNISDCDSSSIQTEALGIRVYSDFNRSVCTNLADLQPNPTRNDTTCFPGVGNCTANFVTLLQGGVTPSTMGLNRAAFALRTSISRFYGGMDPSILTIQTFEGRDCREEARWTQWGNCNQTYDDVCSNLGYSVGSVRLLETPEAYRTGECQIAAERGVSSGAEMGRRSAGTTAILLAIASCLVTYLA